jgi:thymidine phosphorylase
VGLSLRAKLSDKVTEGDPLAIVRYRDEARWVGERERLASAWSIGPEPPVTTDLILERVDHTVI